jgi:hypothetical protein
MRISISSLAASAIGRTLEWTRTQRGEAVPAAASIALSSRFPTIVTRSWGSVIPRRRLEVFGDGQLDSSLCGFGGLPEHELGDGRFPDAAEHHVGHVLGIDGAPRGESKGLAGPPKFDQGDDRVQLVGRLVRLGAQRVRESPDRSSSETRARSSVWSRRVTTVPRRCPAHLAAAWLTTMTRSSVRKISSVRSPPAARAAPMAVGSPKSSTRRSRMLSRGARSLRPRR